jgi:NitT/TauT family transport system substrate-binding protein
MGIYKIKNRFIFIVTLVLLLVVAGCSSSSEKTSGENNDPPSEGPGQSQEQSEEQADDQTQEETAIKPEKDHVNIGLPLHAGTYLPVYLADSKGFFEEEGLTAEIIAFNGDAGVVQALAGGDVDINISSLIGLVNSLKGNQPFKAFWGGFNHPDIGWISFKLDSIADAKGAVFGVTTYGSLTDMLTRYMLKQNGLDPERDVSILQAGPSYQSLPALEAGQLDVSTTSTPSRFTAIDRGAKEILTAREALGPEWPQHIVFAREEYIENNPETIKAFLRAIVRGMEYIESNPEEAAQELVDRLELNEDFAKRTVEQLSPDWDKNGEVGGMDVFWEVAIFNGEVDQPWPEERWLTREFLDTQEEWMR